jgi:cellulose biosynthesis protein BcsQ
MIETSILPRSILIASHRGGSWKSTLSALLALALAEQGITTCVADLAASGGAFSLHREDRSAPRPVAIRNLGDAHIVNHRQSPVTIIHLSQFSNHVGESNPAEILQPLRLGEVLILDAPALGMLQLCGLLRNCDVALLPVPAEAMSLKSLMPFLEAVKENRAMPGRRFETRIVLTGTGLRQEETALAERHARETLAPILAPGELPWNDALLNILNDGRFPFWNELPEALRHSVNSIATDLLHHLNKEPSRP